MIWILDPRSRSGHFHFTHPLWEGCILQDWLQWTRWSLGSYCCDNPTLPNISGNLVISLKHPAKIVVTSFPLFSGKTPLQSHRDKKSGWLSPDGTKLCLLHSVSFAKTHLETLLTAYCEQQQMPCILMGISFGEISFFFLWKDFLILPFLHCGVVPCFGRY